MILKNVFAQRSTYIDSYDKYLNFGRQQTLSVFSSSSRNFNQRMLIKFPDSITAQSLQSANLILSNVQHNLEACDVVTMIMNPLTRDWNEGRKYGDVDQRNYINRKMRTSWSVSGGDYDGSISSQITLNNVYDDVKIDFVPFINYWKSNPNYGIIIRYRDQSASGQQNLYRRYNSVHTNNKLYRPKVMISYTSDGLYDNSNFMTADNSYTLYLNNNVNGKSVDVSSTSNPYNVTIVGISAGMQQAIDSAYSYRVSTGLYSATGLSLPASALAYDSISAKWSNTASVYYPTIYKKLNIISPTRSSNDTSEQITFMLSNRKQLYKKNQKILLKPMMFKYKNIRLLDGNSTNVIISDSMYFRAVDYNTDKIVIDWTKVQYNQRQNFIFIDLNNIFMNDDNNKYSFVIQIKAQNVYGQTLIFGQSIFDNSIISII